LPAGAGGRRHARVRRLLPPFVPAAFWATGRREVRNSYGDPPLLHRTALGRRFAQLLEGAS
jgi:hypothetical protein